MCSDQPRHPTTRPSLSLAPDLASEATHTVTAADLTDGADRTAGTRFTVTSSWLHDWTNLPVSPETRQAVTAVMTGVQIEPRHPAFRVAVTDDPTVWAVNVLNTVRVTFHNTGAQLLWLACSTIDD